MRFPGFEGEWEHYKLGRFVEFKVTNSFSRENLNYETGSVKNIHYGDIHTKFQTIFDITKENVPYVNSQISLVRISDDFYCKEGDIIFADASEDLKDVGKSIEIANLNGEKVLSGLHTLLARPKTNHFQKGFSGYLFRSTNVRLQIQKEAQGSKVLSINVGRLSNIVLSIPSIPEQKKIADFLSLIEERIVTQNKIIDSLETLIKGLSQKLFAQKLRFKDEQENDFPDWQENFGDSLFESISNKNHNSDLPILAITQEHGAIPRDMIDYNVSVSNKSIESYKVVKKGDFIISLRSFQGGIEFSNYEGICSPAYIVLRPIKEVNRNFFRMYFKTTRYIKRLTKNLEGIRDGKMISFKYFSEVTIPTPSIEEQAKVTNFLFSIERKIEIGRKVLAQYENQKSYLLQNMFI